MNTVYFPLFNLEIHLNKSAFSLFGVSVHWYAIIILIGIIMVLLLCKKASGRYGITYETIVDFSLWVIPISFISARLYYVCFNFDLYRGNLVKILDFRSGGLAIYGGIIGAIITIFIICKKRKIQFFDVLDYLAPFLPLAQSLGRWGNFVNVEAYGYETNLPWRMGLLEHGIYKEVHPTFLYESIATLIIFIILYSKRNKRKFKGELSALYLLMYSFVRFFIEGLRTDSLMFFGARVSQLVSLSIFVVSCIVLYKKCKKNKKM